MPCPAFIRSFADRVLPAASIPSAAHYHIFNEPSVASGSNPAYKPLAAIFARLYTAGNTPRDDSHIRGKCTCARPCAAPIRIRRSTPRAFRTSRRRTVKARGMDVPAASQSSAARAASSRASQERPRTIGRRRMRRRHGRRYGRRRNDAPAAARTVASRQDAAERRRDENALCLFPRRMRQGYRTYF